jgi:hypothetical protein
MSFETEFYTGSNNFRIWNDSKTHTTPFYYRYWGAREARDTLGHSPTNNWDYYHALETLATKCVQATTHLHFAGAPSLAIALWATANAITFSSPRPPSRHRLLPDELVKEKSPCDLLLWMYVQAYILWLLKLLAVGKWSLLTAMYWNVMWVFIRQPYSMLIKILTVILVPTWWYTYSHSNCLLMRRFPNEAT